MDELISAAAQLAWPLALVVSLMADLLAGLLAGHPALDVQGPIDHSRATPRILAPRRSNPARPSWTSGWRPTASARRRPAAACWTRRAPAARSASAPCT